MELLCQYLKQSRGNKYSLFLIMGKMKDLILVSFLLLLGCNKQPADSACRVGRCFAAEDRCQGRYLGCADISWDNEQEYPILEIVSKYILNAL
jgi:hypothetical protein